MSIVMVSYGIVYDMIWHGITKITNLCVSVFLLSFYPELLSLANQKKSNDPMFNMCLFHNLNKTYLSHDTYYITFRMGYIV